MKEATYAPGNEKILKIEQLLKTPKPNESSDWNYSLSLIQRFQAVSNGRAIYSQM